MIDVEALLQPVSPEDPCGPSLEYDKAYLELLRIARGKPEQRQGDAVIPAEEPVWKDVENGAIEILARTKDLRIALLLTKALLHTGGFSGFAQGLAVLRGLIDRYWEPVHPRLDPDDNNDPAARVNILGELADPEGIARWFRLQPIVDARGVGKFNLRDVAIASGELPMVDGAADQALIGAAFAAADASTIVATGAAAREIQTHVKALLGSVNEKVGEGNGPDLSRLGQLADQADRVIREHTPSTGDGEGAVTNGAPNAPGQALSGEVRSRDDVLRALDKIVLYYERNEPSSPVPVLIRRCRRLATMGFMDIMRDVAPSGLSEVEVLRGKTDEESQ
ncbi:MAG TPA: type VI secretion system protein TssA [Polyangiaceae bacterium]